MTIVFWTVAVSIIGVLVGSFLNVVIFRTKKQMPLVSRSVCLTCLEPVSKLDLIPILSFFALKGRCRKCTAVIEWQYPVLELVTGLLFGILFIRAVSGIGYGSFVGEDEWLLVFFRDVIIACYLLIIFVYDFKYKVIPDRFSVPPMIVALLFNFALGAPPLMLLFSGLIIGAFFAAQFIISKGNWVGGGDIRLGLLMGWYLGLPLALVALLLAYISGSIIGIVLILLKHRKLDSHVPFGTFMALAIFVTLFFGDVLLNWYLGLLL